MKEQILELLQTKTDPIDTANIWFELSHNKQIQQDKVQITELLLKLEREGHVKRHDILCMNFWTYRTPNILHRFMNHLRGR